MNGSMMEKREGARLEGLVLWCRADGTVTDVVHDGLGTELAAGSRLGEVLATGALEQGLALLDRVTRGHTEGTVWLPFRDARGGIHVLQVAASEAEHPSGGPQAVLAAAPGPQDLENLLAAIGREHRGLADDLRRSTSVSADADPEAAHDEFRALTEANNELVNMHRELTAERVRLEDANRRKNEILAMVAHDLRNPIGTIVGFSEILQRKLDGTVDPDDRVLLERIEAQGRRLLMLVDDLVDTSVIERGVMHLELADVDVCDLVNEITASQLPAARRKDIRIAVEKPTSRLTARLDRHRIAQVLDNLLSNAIKFTPRATAGTITVRCSEEDGELLLEVTDEGIGIDDQLLPHLFEPFWHRSGAGTDGEPSTGLGLAITDSLVRAHGGGITVASAPGGGSTFLVRLPLHGPDPGAGESPAASPW